MEFPTLTISQARAIGELIRAVDSRGLLAGNTSGQFRAITNAEGNFWFDSDGDIRDAYVWITLDIGMERFTPVPVLLEEIRKADTIIKRGE